MKTPNTLDTPRDIDLTDGRLRITAGGKVPRTFHPLWLRERCPCAECRDPGTGQRLLDAWSLPLDIAVTEAGDEGDRVTITFSDGHAAAFDPAELAAALGPRDEREGIVSWDASLESRPEAEWGSAACDDAALYDLLEKLRRFGFVLVRNVPAEMNAVGEVVARIGPMRITNWGGIADVKAIPNAYDLTMTTRHLEPHADNPYREPVPGYVLLHCLVNDVDGGELLLTDGFTLAETLRQRAPREFDALTRVRPRFRYANKDTELEHSGPLVELDDQGWVRQVRLSNRTELVGAEDPELLDRWYRARRRLTDLVGDPALQIRFKLQPGDLMVMDNYRMLHGRSAYRQTERGGRRHMRQCYMDRDAVASRRKVLARRFGG